MLWSPLRLPCSRLRHWVYLLVAFLFCQPFNFSAQTQRSAEQDKVRKQADLSLAAGTGNISSARIFLEHGADVNGAYLGGVTPLIEASMRDNNSAMVRFLLDSGANVNAKAGNGTTALIYASSRGSLDTALALIEGGADVNASDNAGGSPLTYAISRGHTEVVLALLKAGAKLERQDDHSPSALALAVWGCHADTVNALLKAGAKLAPTDWIKDRPPQFDDFPTHRIYKGKPAAVDLGSNPQAPTYRTRLKEAAPKGPCFAGHYTVAEWGCGSNCQSINFIDVRNGKVIDGVTTDRSAEYRLDSDLFIANPSDDEEFAYEDDPGAFIPISYYVMQNGRLNLIYERACTVKDKRQLCGCEELQKLVLQPAVK